MSRTTGQDFESKLGELEKLVGALEGELPLEEALQLFERGITLSQDLEKYLQSAEQRIEVLKRAADGSIVTEPYKDQAD
jgi:exodeoxyribonuclease VII small subunit